MSDVFISYAHEDQEMARLMATALEGEGFSVWWDHTIPPGKTWDEVIARGIETSLCCIVVWSDHSIGSDWVREEATIAKDRRKLLPVQIGDTQPPVGFRLIQAAQLKGWTGDVRNAQWQMLVREVRTIVGAARAGTTPPVQPVAAAPAPVFTPPPAPPPYTPPSAQEGSTKKPPLGMIIAGVAGLVLVGSIAAYLLQPRSSETEAPPQVVQTAEAPAAAPETAGETASPTGATAALPEASVAPASTSTASTPPATVPPARAGAWDVSRVDAEAGAWRATAPSVISREQPGFYIITNRSRTEDGYAAVGAIVRLLERDDVGARVRVVYGRARGCDTGWWVDDAVLTYLGAAYDPRWERVSDELLRARETERMPEQCNSGRGSAPAASSGGGWTRQRVVAEMGQWRTATSGYYMVATEDGGHRGYVAAGSIVRISQCSRSDQTCEVDIRYGRGSTGCDGWVTTGTNLTYLGASYDRAWEPVARELIQNDSSLGRLRTECAGR